MPLLGTSRLIAELLGHNPDLVPGSGTTPCWRRARPRGWSGAAGPRSSGATPPAASAGSSRWKDRDLARLAVRDVLGLDDLRHTATGLTTLAEATLVAALEDLAPPLPFAVVALGRFGGGELSYASDLDVLFVYDGEGAGTSTRPSAWPPRSCASCGGPRRPSGCTSWTPTSGPRASQGPLARSVGAFAGTSSGGPRVGAAGHAAGPARGRRPRGRPALPRPARRGRVVAACPVRGGVREIRRIKARVERERIPAGEDPDFHLKLGRGSLADVEFTTQLLQLQNGVRGWTPSTPSTASSPPASSIRPTGGAGRRLPLLRGGPQPAVPRAGRPGDSLPEQSDELRKLARSLGTTGWELRESYRRVTRRSRTVVERLFYGRS